MIELLERRQLMAAGPFASVLRDGHTLNVTGTNNSDRIHIGSELYATGSNHKGLAIAYIVFVNDVRLARYESKIERVNVYGLGGRDHIGGLDVPASIISDPRNGQILNQYYPAPMYIEGGSGDDVISGGLGNDTILGGRGNDRIVDTAGQNTVDGNAGDDLIYVNDGVTAGSLGTGTPAPEGTQDIIISEAGRDTVYRDERDELDFVSARSVQAILDDNGGVIVTTLPFGFE